MPEIRPELPPLPERMQELPLDKRGYPVPAFVETINGEFEFRVARRDFREQCLRDQVCWVCGKEFATRHRWYVIGPMCVVNRTTSEPPVHRECAVFSATGCPFLSKPRMVRREDGMPEDMTGSGTGIMRNPGATALYSTREREVYRETRRVGGYLLFLGEPEHVLWYAKGREATYAEVMQSIHSGFPILLAEAEKQGEPALQHLRFCVHRALPWLPKADPDSQEDIEALSLVLEMGKMTGEAVNRAGVKDGIRAR